MSFFCQFVIWMNLDRKNFPRFNEFYQEGEFIVRWDKGSEIVVKGETVLIPAIITELVLEPKPEAKVLEVFANTKSFD